MHDGIQASQRELFPARNDVQGRERLGPAAVVLRGFALMQERALSIAIEDVAAAAPFRHMVTPGGFTMSVAMTNCGTYGWISEPSGYRYGRKDPLSGKHWPAMPWAFKALSERAASAAGFDGFESDVCLVNRYAPGSRLSLHQDRDELDFDQPIVSVSLGLPAVFLFGGLQRRERPARVPLAHGDVVVWGGPDRLRYHGVAPLKENYHPAFGAYRFNLTFRKAA